jgi:hypothetical protein
MMKKFTKKAVSTCSSTFTTYLRGSAGRGAGCELGASSVGPVSRSLGPHRLTKMK